MTTPTFIRGYRLWRTDGERLYTVYSPLLPWEGKRARCTRGVSYMGEVVLYFPDAKHPAPTSDCTCGYYLHRYWPMFHSDWKEQRAGADWTQGRAPYVVGGLAVGWGHVIEHEAGWRVEYAKPEVIFSDDNVMEDVARALALPVVPPPPPPTLGVMYHLPHCGEWSGACDCVTYCAPWCTSAGPGGVCHRCGKPYEEDRLCPVCAGEGQS